MRQTILIPTDFTVQSLSTLKAILAKNEAKTEYNFILIHGLRLSDSISDLLFYSKSKQINSLTNSDFSEAVEIIKNKYSSQIKNITIDVFSGYTISSFNDYLKINNVNQIVTSNRKLKLTNSRSFNLDTYLKKCNLDVTVENLEVKSSVENSKIAEVFLNHSPA